MSEFSPLRDPVFLLTWQVHLAGGNFGEPGEYHLAGFDIDLDMWLGE